MTIFGTSDFSTFKFSQETGHFFGHHTVLKGPEETVTGTKYTYCGASSYKTQLKPCLYLHITHNKWTQVTGFLRKYLLPWRWQTVYFRDNLEVVPYPILACPTNLSSDQKSSFYRLANKSNFEINLIESTRYE